MAEPSVDVTVMPTRCYLMNNVVPVLTQGLEALTLQRPQRPVEYLGKFMLNNAPPRPDPYSGVKEEVVRLVPRPLAVEGEGAPTYISCRTTSIIPAPLRLLPQDPSLI